MMDFVGRSAMPKFDIEVSFPAPMRTVITMDAPNAREAEIAVLALVKSDPYHYKWEVHRPASPKYHAVAGPHRAGSSDQVMTVTQETVTANPTRR